MAGPAENAIPDTMYSRQKLSVYGSSVSGTKKPMYCVRNVTRVTIYRRRLSFANGRNKAVKRQKKNR